MWHCTDELRTRANELHQTSKRDVKLYIGMDRKILLIYYKQFSIYVRSLFYGFGKHVFGHVVHPYKHVMFLPFRDNQTGKRK